MLSHWIISAVLTQYQTARLENMPKWGSKGHSQQKIDIKPISCVTYDMSHIMWAIWDNISFINASFKIKIQAKSFEQAFERKSTDQTNSRRRTGRKFQCEIVRAFLCHAIWLHKRSLCNEWTWKNFASASGLTSLLKLIWLNSSTLFFVFKKLLTLTL